MEQTKPRTRRQSAVARYRQERLARREVDRADRKAALKAVSDRVSELADDTHLQLKAAQKELKDKSLDRHQWSQDMRKALAAMHKDLIASNLDMSREAADALDAYFKSRIENGLQDWQDRQNYLEQLRADVVRIATGDFIDDDVSLPPIKPGRK